MKTITAREHDLILDIRNEGLTSLPPGIFEKDLLITELLQTVSSANIDGIELVFCGGTCLSKAHGLIERMSEDVDFKLIVADGLSRSARNKLLSQFKKRLTKVLEDANYHIPAEQIIACDENNYVSLNLHYKSQFPQVASLRSEIKLEFNARSPALPTKPLPIRSLLDTVIQAPKAEFIVECISVVETLAEKILSFLRRTAEVRAGRNRADYDDRLVRHMYDIRAIACQRKKRMFALPHEHFAKMVASDAIQYRNQYPEFEQDPIGQMRTVLTALQSEADYFERQYLQFVDELVFGEPVSFVEARRVFIALASRLLRRLELDR